MLGMSIMKNHDVKNFKQQKKNKFRHHYLNQKWFIQDMVIFISGNFQNLFQKLFKTLLNTQNNLILMDVVFINVSNNLWSNKFVISEFCFRKIFIIVVLGDLLENETDEKSMRKTFERYVSSTKLFNTRN